MAKYNVECVVLKSKNFKDADKILTFYSKEKGKFSAIAKGVRKITSRRAGSLDTLTHVKVGIHEGSSGIGIVTEAKALDSFKNVKKNLDIAKQAYYVAKLVDRFVEEDEENVELFRLLLTTLTGLNNVSVEKVLGIVNPFEVAFMHILGYELTLDRCVVCNTVFETTWPLYKFDFEKGGFVCKNCKAGVKISRELALVLNQVAKSGFFEEDVLSFKVDSLLKRYIREKLGDVVVSLY